MLWKLGQEMRMAVSDLSVAFKKLCIVPWPHSCFRNEIKSNLSEMTQVLYAHMNNKTIKKMKKK
jgi:Mor family transcriptional regulator